MPSMPSWGLSRQYSAVAAEALFQVLLAVYVREKGLLTLERAVRKMSGAATARLGLRHKGLVRRGMDAGMARRLRVGIVGLDHWYAGLGAAEQVAKNERVELVAIAHRDERRGRETAEKFGAKEFTLDHEAMAARGDLDLVVTACYCPVYRRRV